MHSESISLYFIVISWMKLRDHKIGSRFHFEYTKFSFFLSSFDITMFVIRIRQWWACEHLCFGIWSQHTNYGTKTQLYHTPLMENKFITTIYCNSWQLIEKRCNFCCCIWMVIREIWLSILHTSQSKPYGWHQSHISLNLLAKSPNGWLQWTTLFFFSFSSVYVMLYNFFKVDQVNIWMTCIC